MDRPEKFKFIVSTPNKKEDRFKFHEDCGYNRAIDDYELWLEEVASVEKIVNIISKIITKENVIWCLEHNSSEEMISDIAKEIHKLIGK